jgi:hypothetical protein
LGSNAAITASTPSRPLGLRGCFAGKRGEIIEWQCPFCEHYVATPPGDFSPSAVARVAQSKWRHLSAYHPGKTAECDRTFRVQPLRFYKAEEVGSQATWPCPVCGRVALEADLQKFCTDTARQRKWEHCSKEHPHITHDEWKRLNYCAVFDHANGRRRHGLLAFGLNRSIASNVGADNGTHQVVPLLWPTYNGQRHHVSRRWLCLKCRRMQERRANFVTKNVPCGPNRLSDATGRRRALERLSKHSSEDLSNTSGFSAAEMRCQVACQALAQPQNLGDCSHRHGGDGRPRL